ncbi:hypothetical protein HNR33_003186 [Brassicibacter mesophilus]
MKYSKKIKMYAKKAEVKKILGAEYYGRSTKTKNEGSRCDFLGEN